MEVRDDEIIKALECCQVGESCKGCPSQEKFGKDAICPHLNELAVDLINRQKAEIERLRRPNRAYPFCNLLGECLVFSKNLKDYNDMRKGIESEARKDFAERLKKKTYPFPCAIGVENAVTIRGINDLLAEMESERG